MVSKSRENEEKCLKAKEKVPKARGAQIDMLIDRADKTINVCEMKLTFPFGPSS